MKFLDKFRKNKEPDFFELLTKQAELINKGIRLLNEYCMTHDEAVADAVVKAEDDGDMVRRVLVDDMNKTFITPFDREDLFKLSAKLDEVLDYAKTSVDEIRLFKITPDDEMTEITTALHEMSEHIILAVSNITADFRSIFKYREIYRHLNQTADIADEAMDCLLKILVKK